MDDFANMLIAKHESSYKLSGFYQSNAFANETVQNPQILFSNFSN